MPDRRTPFVNATERETLFAGLDVAMPTDALVATDTAETLLTAYLDTIRRNNEIVAAAPDPDVRCAHPHREHGPMSLRWVLVHVVEETGRHAGHADILREQSTAKSAAEPTGSNRDSGTVGS